MSTVLALSGGGARAAAQVGAIRAVIDSGIAPDTVIGSSAGAVNGAWYALFPNDLDALETVWHGLTRRGVFPGTAAHYAINLWRRGHVHPIESWARILERHYGGRNFEDTKIPFHVLTVRLSDGTVVTHSSGPITPVLKASTAVPGLFPPQDISGEFHVDGAVVEFLPVPTAVRMGATRIIAVDSSDFPDGDGSAGFAMDRCGQIAATAWVKMVVESARAGGVEVIHIRPPLGDIYDGRDFRHTRRLIEDGYTFAAAQLAKARQPAGIVS